MNLRVLLFAGSGVLNVAILAALALQPSLAPSTFRDLLNDPFFATDDVSATQRRQFGNLSRQKVDSVQRIEDDYSEMTSAIRAAMAGITLPEDRDKLALLAREKHADLAAVLTPGELADYELRSSPITSLLR